MENKTKLTMGIFVVLAALAGSIGTYYYIAPEDLPKTYFCEENNIIGLCFKLSAINDNGLQLRCYYNESAPTKYKTCNSGWTIYQPKEEEIEGKEIEITDEIEEIRPISEKSFSTDKEAEDFMKAFVEPVKNDIRIVKAVSYYGSNSIMIEYCMNMTDMGGFISMECDTFNVEKPLPTKEELLLIAQSEAEKFALEYSPQINYVIK